MRIAAPISVYGTAKDSPVQCSAIFGSASDSEWSGNAHVTAAPITGYGTLAIWAGGPTDWTPTDLTPTNQTVLSYPVICIFRLGTF